MPLCLPPPLWLDGDSRSYHVHMPHDLYRRASCEEVDCDQWRNGWETTCPVGDPTGDAVATMIRSGATGRTYKEMADMRDGVAVAIFRFESGQRCFQEHRTRPGRLLVHQRGRVAREHSSLADLAEDYTEHVGHLADQRERG